METALAGSRTARASISSTQSRNFAIAWCSPLAAWVASCIAVATSFVILRGLPSIVAVTGAFAASIRIVLRFFEPFGRPKGLPDTPLGNRYF